MKKFGLLVSLLAVALSTPILAQEKSADEYKNEGNEFVRTKKYQQALDSYKQAITLWGDNVDAATVFNAGICATNIKDFDLANQYYDKAIEMNYKPGDAAYRKARILKSQKKEDEYAAAIEAGYKTYTNGKIAMQFKKSYVAVLRDKAADKHAEGVKITEAMQKPGVNLVDLKAKLKSVAQEGLPFIEQALTINPDDAASKKVKTALEGLITTAES